jgi:signal transduction histidine kinase
VIAGLRPTVLDDFGLVSALGIQVQSLVSAGWQVEYIENLGTDRLPAAVETALFRVTQEALTNVRKHARTNRVCITLRRERKVVSLTVRDWGCGFVPSVVNAPLGPGERIGLPGMRERIARLGGHWQIDSIVGEGTSVSAEVTLP